MRGNQLSEIERIARLLAGRPAGAFVAVVGPSGAGKDTLIRHAHKVLADDADVHFARRIVTRAADNTREAHQSVDASEFAAMETEGAFALSWQAHGLHYALPSIVNDWLAGGDVVVANVSRTVLPLAVQRLGPTVVAHVTASHRLLQQRLEGRAGAGNIASRLERTVEVDFDPRFVLRIDNSGTIADAGGLLVALCRALGLEKD